MLPWALGSIRVAQCLLQPEGGVDGVEIFPERPGWSQTNIEIPPLSRVSTPGGLSCAAIKVCTYADDISVFIVEKKKIFSPL